MVMLMIMIIAMTYKPIPQIRRQRVFQAFQVHNIFYEEFARPARDRPLAQSSYLKLP